MDQGRITVVVYNLITLFINILQIEGCFDVARISKVLADQNLGLLSAEEVKDAHAARDLVLKIRSADSLYQDLLSRYPEEKDALQSFFRLCKWGEIVFPLFAVYISLPRILTFWVSWAVEPVLKIFFGSSTYTVLSSLTKNEDLIGALTWCYGNSVPFFAPYHRASNHSVSFFTFLGFNTKGRSFHHVRDNGLPL